jgi:hypothetical protein
MADGFLTDTQAPSLSLYLTKTSNGLAYNVVREADDECLLIAAKRPQVTAFLRGYEAALSHPSIAALNDAIDDAGNERILDCAIKVANIRPRGAS